MLKDSQISCDLHNYQHCFLSLLKMVFPSPICAEISSEFVKIILNLLAIAQMKKQINIVLSRYDILKLQ